MEEPLLPISIAMLSKEVLNKVFLKLTVNDLKNVRQVCSLWANVVDSIVLPKKAQTLCSFKKDYTTSSYPSYLLPQSTVDTHGFQRLSPLKNHWLELMERDGQKLKHLSLTDKFKVQHYKRYAEGRVEFLNNVLRLSSNIESLDVKLNIAYRFWKKRQNMGGERFWMFDPRIQFPNLNELKLTLDVYLGQKQDQRTTVIWIRQFLRLAVNISILCIGDHQHIARGDDFIKHVAYPEDGENLLPKLKNLKIFNFGWFEEVAILPLLFSPGNCIALQTLELARLPFKCVQDHVRVSTELEQILMHHSQTLEQLKLHVELQYGRTNPFVLPSMPKLKTLKYNLVLETTDGEGTLRSYHLDPLHIGYKFQSRRILELGLPELRNLQWTFELCNPEVWDVVYEPLIGNHEAVPQIQSLVVSPPKMRRHYEDFIANLAHRFPSLYTDTPHQCTDSENVFFTA